MLSPPRASWAFAVLGTAALVFASGLAAAVSDADGDGIPDDLEASTARNVLTHSAPESFVVRSRSVGAPQDDAFEVSYARGEFTVGYSPKSFGPDSVSYTMAFSRIVEFYLDANAGWVVVQQVDLESEYAEVRATDATTLDGEREVVFSVETQSGLFTVTLGATERFARTTGGLISPMEVKVDLAIRNWAWVRSDTRLGLRVDFNTTDRARAEATSEDEARGWAADESQVNVTAGNDSLFFSWARTAMADGMSVPVESTPLEPRTGGYEMYLVYPHADAIAHDPKIGAVSEAFWSIWSEPRTPPIQADLTVYLVGLGVVAALVAATVLLVRRRRNA